MKNKGLCYLDLFAGAGGLSEGFVRAGYTPIAHVESDVAACYTLRTRAAWHWLRSQGAGEQYCNYLDGKLSRPELYELVPEQCIASVINKTIDAASLRAIFQRIDSLLGNRKLDLIIGGPPCQAYSIIGRARDHNRMRGDNRNYLYKYYGEFLQRYQPSVFVFENVIGLLSASDSSKRLYLDEMISLFRKFGYFTEFMTLSAENYGVLQNRRRVFLVGTRGRSSGFFPVPEQWHPKAFVKDALSDLPSITAGCGISGPIRARSRTSDWLQQAEIYNGEIPITWHQARSHTAQDLEIYKIAVELWNGSRTRLNYNSLPEHLKTHEGRTSFLDRFKVVAADLPYSHTIVAHIAKDGHYYIHPDIAQNRSLTPREAARLQSFPDDYYFESADGRPRRTPAFRQIGNAVPVLLAQRIATKLLETWK